MMKKYVTIGVILFLIVYFGSALSIRSKYMKIYNDGVSLLESGDYEYAVEQFKKIPNYENYQNIQELLDNVSVCPQCGTHIK